jgi:hypothetical protein
MTREGSSALNCQSCRIPHGASALTCEDDPFHVRGGDTMVDTGDKWPEGTRVGLFGRANGLPKAGETMALKKCGRRNGLRTNGKKSGSRVSEPHWVGEVDRLT